MVVKHTILLHFYQPFNQQKDILERIVFESYLPITKGLLEIENSKVVVNISGVLTQMLSDNGYSEVIENFVKLGEQNKIEFTSSGMYHTILPLISDNEIRRQIMQNEETNKKYFGEVYAPVGFFPPEMAVDEETLNLVADMGYKWCAMPQISYGKQLPDYSKVYKYKDTDLALMFRNKRVSSLILSAQVRSAKDLVKETQDITSSDSVFFSVMDAETFGHHRIGHEKLLFDLLKSHDIQHITVSELLDQNLLEEKVHEVIPATWTNSEQDEWLFSKNKDDVKVKTFILWNDPTNPIHKLQWKLTNFVLDELEKNKELKSWQDAREIADYAIASDQFWWASTKPWWSLEMIELGAYNLKQVINTLYKDVPKEKTEQAINAVLYAEQLYRQILDQAFEWQRSGYIRQKSIHNSDSHGLPPLKERTPSEWFNQLILEFEYEMDLASQNQDFEKAIKWRDAVKKISLGTDKHDILHVVNELWTGRSIGWGQTQVKPFLHHDWNEFSDFAKEHFLEVESKEAFEKWKQKKRMEDPEFFSKSA